MAMHPVSYQPTCSAGSVPDGARAFYTGITHENRSEASDVRFFASIVISIIFGHGEMSLPPPLASFDWIGLSLV